MIAFALLLFGAALAYGVAKRFRISPVPLLILAGVALSRITVIPQEFLQEALVLGLTFLLFAIGIELNPQRARAQGGAAIRVGLVQFAALGILGVLASLALGLGALTSLYLGLALTASSTFVVIRLLISRKQLFEPIGRLLVGVLLVQDLLVILLIPLLVRAPAGWVSMVQGLLGTLGMVALVFACLRWVAPRITRLQWEDEPLLLAALAVLFVFVGLADLLELPLAVGAFLAGVALSSFPVRGIVRGQLFSVTDFFTAIFFIALGGLLTFEGFAPIFQAFVLSLVVIVATPPIVTYLIERSGFSARPAIEAGLLISQTSELSLVVGLHALVLGQIGRDIFTILALVTVFTLVLTPFLARDRVVEALLRLHPLRARNAGEAEPASGHVLLIGCGAGGLPLLETLITAGEEVVVIDDDPEIVDFLRGADVFCIRGDATDPAVLTAAGAQSARLISATIRRPRDSARLLEMVRGAPVLIRVFDDEDADWVRERGGIPVPYAAAGAEAFLHWFEHSSALGTAVAPGLNAPVA